MKSIRDEWVCRQMMTIRLIQWVLGKICIAERDRQGETRLKRESWSGFGKYGVSRVEVV